jgi:hypothetical protein
VPKRRHILTASALWLLSIAIATGGKAQDFEPAMEELQPIDLGDDHFKVSALLFGDAFSIQGHHLEDFDGESGWWTRRIYVTTDFANFGLGDTVIRLRLEANQLDDFSTDYSSKVKDAYVQFRPGNHRIWLGRAPTLAFSSVEEHWGYRWFERTPLDLQGTPSRFDGLRLAGPLTPDGPFYYRFGAGQTSDLGFATDKVKRGQLAFTYMPEDRRLFFDLYLDYLEESEDENEDSAWSFQLFGGWSGESSYAGLLYFERNWENLVAERLRIASAYYVHTFGNRHWDIVTRIDYLFDPSIEGDDIRYMPFDPTARATALFGGIDIKLHKYVDIMPNVKYVTYDKNDDGLRPDDDAYLNLTLSLKVP